jgi:spoIIIJ-associated protein
MTRPVTTIIEELLSVMGYMEASVSVSSDETGIVYDIQTEDGRKLIGRDGANLAALNHIVKRIVEIDTGEYGRFGIDVNGYQKERNESLRRQARMIAERVRSLAADSSMEPMDGYERMIVHAAIASIPDVTTESIGRGTERHIVVKYTPGNKTSGNTDDVLGF